MLRDKLLLTLALLVLSSLILAVAYYAGPSTGYIKFTIELYDDKGRRITSPLGIPTVPGNLKILAQVYALTPPNSGDVVVEVFRGEVKGGSLTLYPKGRLGEVAEAWVRFEESRGVDPEYSSVGLELNLWIVEEGSGEVLQRVSYYYIYNPELLLSGAKWNYTVKVALDPSATDGSAGDESDCIARYAWRLKYSVAPEMHPSVFGEDYVKYRDGAWYVRLPVLVIYNKSRNSGAVNASVWFSVQLSKLKFMTVVGIAAGVEEKLRQGDPTGGLDGMVYVGGASRVFGPSPYVALTSYWSLNQVGGDEWGYVWVWARPLMLFYNEYHITYCNGFPAGEEYTGVDRIVILLQDIAVEYMRRKDTIDLYMVVGDKAQGPLPSYITRWLSNDEISVNKLIWVLEPGEGLPLRLALLAAGRGSGEFILPAGLALTPILEEALPHFTLIAAMTPIVVVEEGVEPVFNGGIYNEGPYKEYLYIKLSKLRFAGEPPWQGTWREAEYQRVPLAVYLEAR